MTHVQCFVFYENFKTNSQKKNRKHLFGLATTNAFCLCVHLKKQNNYQYQYSFGRLFTS